MWTNLFKRNKEVYFVEGIDIEFNHSNDCTYFCEVARINKSAAKQMESAMKLTFDHSDILIKKEVYYEGEIGEAIPLTEAEKQFKFVNYPVQTPGHLISKKKGIHYFGGNPPEELEIPTLEGSTVCYLGKIDKKEKLFPWLDFDLHLICPIFLDFSEPISIDYSNPLKPVFINKETIEENEYCDKEAMKNIDHYTIYSKQCFSFKPTNKGDYLDDLPTEGNFGVPRWDHQPLLPYCPKTGKKMTFVLRTLGVESKLLSDIPNSINQGNEKEMMFGGGNFHIFFQPESKVLTYFAQY